MPSFDVVSEVNMQEVKNAVDQAQREIATRYDFRNSKTTMELDEKASTITLLADDKMRLAATVDILKQKLSKRSVSLKSAEFVDAVAAAGDMLRQVVKIKMALTEEERKRINKLIKETKMKVTSQIQGDQVRVTGKNRDDLQTAIAHLKSSVNDVDLQFINFRD